MQVNVCELLFTLIPILMCVACVVRRLHVRFDEQVLLGLNNTLAEVLDEFCQNGVALVDKTFERVLQEQNRYALLLILDPRFFIIYFYFL